MSVDYNFFNSTSPTTYVSITAGRTLGCWSVGHAVSRLGVEAEELGTHSLVLEAGIRSPIPAALGVQREQGSRQGSTQGAVLMWGIVQAGGRISTGKSNQVINTLQGKKTNQKLTSGSDGSSAPCRRTI